MRSFAVQEVLQLQSKPENIRNICILAHVDHGQWCAKIIFLPP